MSLLALRLPMPPSSNHRLILVQGPGKKARLVLAPDHRAWKKAAIPAIRSQLPPFFTTIWATVEIELELVLATLASDVTNRMKTLEDALQESDVLENDRQVGDARQFSTRFTNPGEPEFVVVTVRLADPTVYAERNRRLRTAIERAAKEPAKRTLRKTRTVEPTPNVRGGR